MPTSAQPGTWEYPEEDRESRNLEHELRRRAAEKMLPDTLMPETVAYTLALISRAKGTPGGL